MERKNASFFQNVNEGNNYIHTTLEGKKMKNGPEFFPFKSKHFPTSLTLVNFLSLKIYVCIYVCTYIRMSIYCLLVYNITTRCLKAIFKASKEEKLSL